MQERRILSEEGGIPYNLVITDNQNGDSGAANNATATIKYTLNGETFILGNSFKNGNTFVVPEGSAITVLGNTYDSNHYTPQSATLNNTTYTITYNSMKATITSDSNISTVVLKVNNTNVWLGTNTTYYIPWGKSWSCLGYAKSGYLNPHDLRGTANTATITISMTARLYAPYIYAYYSDGSTRSYSTADSGAIGVLIAASTNTVIEKHEASNLKFGGDGYDLSSVFPNPNIINPPESTNGDTKTTALINALSGYTDKNGVTGCPAAEYCRSKGSQWFLPAWGNFLPFSSDLESVNYMLTKIGGTLLSGYYWLCAVPYKTTSAWYEEIKGPRRFQSRNDICKVRAFMKI